MTYIPQRWCHHDGEAGESPVCSHLRASDDEWLTFHRWYLGTGMESDLVCPLCAKKRESGEEVATRYLCGACFGTAIDKYGDNIGVKGTPELRINILPFDSSLDSTTLGTAPVIDIAIAKDLIDTTFTITEEGHIYRIEHPGGESHLLAEVSVAEESGREPWAGQVRKPHLHVSNGGSFAAVATDFGRFGSVVNLENGNITMELDGGDYHPETVPFSLTFAEHAGRPVLVHRTEWNRLEVSDPSDGTLLTEREPVIYKQDEDRPDNYLDYFHGALHLSPDGRTILDDGWVWHPFGLPIVWSLSKWLSANPWESENGDSQHDICSRGYYWNHGFCWLDDRHIAVEGIGEDDSDMIEGVRVFELGQTEQTPENPHYANEVTSFVGPTGRFFADQSRLFSSNTDGLSIWNISDGALIGQLKGFSPTAQSQKDRMLIGFTNSTIQRWRY